jgi:hypothetical protein
VNFESIDWNPELPEFLVTGLPIEIRQETDFPYSLVRTREEAEREAAALGLVLVEPGPNELQIDIDDYESEKVFYTNLEILGRYISVVSSVVIPSKSGGVRKHITVTLVREVTPLERIALQAVLGSDRKREVLSLIRVFQGDENPTLFFEKPLKPMEEIEKEMEVISF